MKTFISHFNTFSMMNLQIWIIYPHKTSWPSLRNNPFRVFPHFSNSAAADFISEGKTGESTHGDEWHIPYHQVVFRNIVGKTYTLRPDSRSGATSFLYFSKQLNTGLGCEFYLGFIFLQLCFNLNCMVFQIQTINFNISVFWDICLHLAMDLRRSEAGNQQSKSEQIILLIFWHYLRTGQWFWPFSMCFYFPPT